MLWGVFRIEKNKTPVPVVEGQHLEVALGVGDDRTH